MRKKLKPIIINFENIFDIPKPKRKRWKAK